MTRPIFRIKPRFSDFNLQGLLKGSLHFDFVCEAQLEFLSSRYGIDFSKYAKTGRRWNPTDFRIFFHEENRSLDPFLVEADIVRLEGSDKEVAFAFWNEAHTLKYASGVILFRLFDDKKREYIPIDANDISAFIGGGALKSEAF